MQPRSSARIPVGISQCLIGDPVRFNAGHKHSRLCTDQLGALFDLRPVCPEVAIGLGTPRKPIRLVGDPTAPRAVGTVNRDMDVTEALQHYADEVHAGSNDLCGFIVMQKSPSCGMERVKVYEENGHPASATGQGVFTARLMQHNPLLPVEEEGRLHDPVLRENFITRVYAHAEWQRLLQQGLTRRALIAFHSRYKYLLMATDPMRYKSLGRLLGRLADYDLADLAPQYFSELMSALKKCATRGTHSNVLQHLSGYLKRALSADEKQEMQQLIGQYRDGIVPLVVPLTLLKHHFRRHPDRYIAEQAYLQPHPEPLSLRNAL